MQAPALATRTPAAAATQGLLYVMPLQPHCGLSSRVQISGRATQAPRVPHPVPAQYCVEAQSALLPQPPGLGMQHARQRTS